MNEPLHAAVATEDITPEVGCALAAYQRTEPSRGVLDRLELTSLVLRSHASTFVWITVDNVVFLVGETDPIRRAVAGLCETAASHVMVSFSHTHSGPAVDAEYVGVVSEKAGSAVTRCLKSLAPASVGWAVVLADASVNRRAAGTSKAAPSAATSGPVDRRAGILRVNDAAGRPMAALIRYSAHGTVLKGDNLLISADWPGALRDRLRPVLRCPVMVANGSAGDSNPRWRGSPEDLKRVADEIARPVISVFDSIQTSSGPCVAALSENITLNCEDIPNPREADAIAEETARQWGGPTERWRAEVSRRWYAHELSVRLPVEVQVVRIGDAIVAGVPMETFTEQAIEFAARFPNRPAFLNGYTNGWLGYMPGDDDLRLGGYEVRWAPVIYGWESGWLTPIRPGAGKRLVESALRLAELLLAKDA